MGERHSLDCHRQVNYSRAEGGDGLAYWVGEAQPRRTHTHIHNGRLVIKFSVNHYGSLTLPICEKNFFFPLPSAPTRNWLLFYRKKKRISETRTSNTEGCGSDNQREIKGVVSGGGDDVVDRFHRETPEKKFHHHQVYSSRGKTSEKLQTQKEHRQSGIFLPSGLDG